MPSASRAASSAERPPAARSPRLSATRLTWAMALILLVINGAFAAGMLVLRADAHREARGQLFSNNYALAAEVSNRLLVVDTAMQAAVRSFYKNGRELSAVNRQMLLMRGESARDGTALLATDAQGAVVLDSRSTFPRAANVSKMDFFLAQSGMSPKSGDGDSDAAAMPFIGKVVKSQLDGHYYICLSRRLSDANGRFAGIVFASVPTAALAEDFNKYPLGKQGTTTLVRDDGTVLARYPEARDVANASLANSTLYAYMPKLASASFVTESMLDHIPRLYVYSRIAHTSLVLSTGMSLAVVETAWRAQMRLMLLADLVISLGLICLTWFLRRDFQYRQLGQLATMRNESLFRGALNGSSIGTALVELNREISFVNPALALLRGEPIDALTGHRLHALLGPEQWQEDVVGLEQLESCTLAVYSAERRFDRVDGSPMYGLISVTLVRSARGSPRFFVVQVQDITQRVMAEHALGEQNDRWVVTFASIADGVVTTDQQGLVRTINPAAEMISGWSHAETLGRPVATIFALRDPVSGAPLQDVVRRALSAPRATHVSIAGVLMDRQGWRREIACNASAVRAESGEVLGTVLVFRDVGESKELHRKLAYTVSHDALTGLPNRNAFADTLDAALVDVKSQGKQHALAFMDLDRFKIVNDTAGHRAGDLLLKQIALLVPTVLRFNDTVARLGGDQFGIVLRDASIDEAKVLLVEVIDAINAMPFSWEGRAYSVGASIGLTAINADAVSPNALLTQADVACYAAKNDGRNCVNVYSGEQSDAADLHRKIVLAAGITEAIQEGRICLYGQKVLPNDPNEPARWELLARMFDRDGTPVPTSIFIPAAERYDLMGHIDRWNLEKALSELKRAYDLGVLVPVHVNLSANSLNDPAFVSYALAEIEASGVPPTALTFEITETALMRNLAAATVALRALRAVGIQIALDDFGIGLSSFGYLRHFPVDVVKIDGGFVVNMIDNAVDRNIVKSIHQITRDLGARTVAESVEDDATLMALKQMGIDFFQGYGIHRPEPLADVIDQEIARVNATRLVEPDVR